MKGLFFELRAFLRGIRVLAVIKYPKCCIFIQNINYKMKSIIQSVVLCLFGFSLAGQDSDLLGIVDDQLIGINSSTNAVSIIGDINPSPPILVRFLAYVEEDCLIYAIMNSGAAPTLVSIDMDLNFTQIGLLTLPGNTIYFCESIAFNSTDNTLYASVSIDGNQSGGDYASETIVEVNRSTAGCQFKTEIIDNVADPDIDKMTFCDDILYMFDGAPGQWSKYFEIDFPTVGATVEPNELATYGYAPIKDIECHNGNVYFTTGRDLSIFNTASYTINNLGNLFGPSDFGGDEITGLCVNPFPDYLDLGDDVSLCDEDDYLIELEYPYQNVTWNDGSTGSSLLVFDSGQYWADVVYKNCTFRTDTIDITFAFPLEIPLVSDTVLCEGEILLLTINEPGVDVEWSDGTVGNSLEISEAGVYWAEYSKDGCTFLTDEVVVDVLEGDYNLGDDVNLCEGETYVLNIPGVGQNISWNNGFTGNNLVVSLPGLYWADVMISNCVFRTDSIFITVTEPINYSLGDDVTICQGETVFYSINVPNIDILWSDGTNGNDIEISEPGLYWAEYVKDGCTFYSDTIIVEMVEGDYDLGQDMILCEGESFILEVEGVGPNISWNNGYTGNPIEISESGIYWADVMDNGCLFRTDSIEVMVAEPLDLTTMTDTVLCNEESVTFTIDEPDIFVLWSDGTSGNEITISESGLYWAQYFIDGCSFQTDTIDVDIVHLTTTFGWDVEMCDESYTLFLEGVGQAVTWNNGMVGNPIEITEPGTYWAEIHIEGCNFQTDTFNITQVEPLEFNTVSDTVICYGASIDFAINSPGIDVSWSDGSIGDMLMINESGTYWGEYTIGDCTFYSDTINVEVVENELSIGEDVTLCEGESYTLNVEGVGQNISWNNGYTGNNLVIDEAGLYWAEIIFNDCEFRTDTMEVTYVQPLDYLIGTHTTLCPGETLTLSIDEPNIDVIWSDGTVGHQLVISETGLYWAEYILDGCTFSTDTIYVEVVEIDIDINTNITLCEGETYTINLEGVGQNINWSNGYTGNNIIITEPGLYWADVILDDCTFRTDSVMVSLISPAQIDLQSDTVICQGETIYLAIDEPNVNVLWSDGSMNGEIAISEEGIYWAEYIKEGCTFNTDTIHVDVVDAEYDLGEDVNICSGESYILEIEGVGQNVVWNNGQTGNQLEITEEGEYFADVVLNNCSFQTNTISVSVSPIQTIDIGKDTILCGEDEVTLVVENTSFDYQWSTGEVASSIVVKEDGLFWASTLDLECPSHSDSIQVRFIEDPNVIYDIDTLLCFDEVIELTNPNYDIEWKNEMGENLSTISESGIFLGTYQLEECLFKTDTLKVEFTECAPCEYYIPNVISPNSDGMNDGFEVIFTKGCEILDFEMSIFDRWGNLISISKDNYWDGEFNAKPVANGVYVYMIQMSTSSVFGETETLMISGDVTVLK